MRTPAEHVLKARSLLAEADFLLSGGFLPGAGRDAYLAAFHAALAHIVAQTAREPKTHRGTRSEFARITQGDDRFSFAVKLLGRGYDIKVQADYDDGEPISLDEAMAAMADAKRLVDLIESLLPPV